MRKSRYVPTGEIVEERFLECYRLLIKKFCDVGVSFIKLTYPTTGDEESISLWGAFRLIVVKYKPVSLMHKWLLSHLVKVLISTTEFVKNTSLLVCYLVIG